MKILPLLMAAIHGVASLNAEPLEDGFHSPPDAGRPTVEEAAGALRPVGLRVDDRDGAPVVLRTDLAFSWRSESSRPGEWQTAYQIDIPGHWKSGKVSSADCLGIEYGGPKLPETRELSWRVRVWDRDDRPSGWSRPAVFRIASSTWRAPWIAARAHPMNPPLGQRYTPRPGLTGDFAPDRSPRSEVVRARKEFHLPETPVRATARIAALGFTRCHINGQAVDDRAMSPPLSDWSRRFYFNTVDVTRHLRAGDNALALQIANGYFSTPGRGWGKWYGIGSEPAASLELDVELADGRMLAFDTGSGWKWKTGEIIFNDFFIGERHDRRLLEEGWMSTGFNDSDWAQVAIVPGPAGAPEPNPCPPVRPIRDVAPVSRQGNTFHFATMHAGWPVLRVRGKAGAEVRVTGSSDERFVLRGDPGGETLEPRFIIHSIGPEVKVEAADVDILDMKIRRAHSDLRMTGGFECSDPFLNNVMAVLLHTHLNYTFDYPMDPTREKTGWTQDVQGMFDSASYLTDMQLVYRRWWRDFHDTQAADGAVGSVAPLPLGGVDDIWNDPWWGGMIIHTPWKLYQHYGDQRILREAYPNMVAYLDLLGRKAGADGLLRWAGASDWIEVGVDHWGPPKRTPHFVTSTCAWYHYADIVSKVADHLGLDQDNIRYRALADKIAETFNRLAYDPGTGLYAGAADSQAALVMPLALGLTPEAEKAKVIGKLAENIRSREGHLSTGFVATPILLDFLPQAGLAPLAHGIVTKRGHPGWDSLISGGVMRETWKGGMAQMPSLGGSIGGFLFQHAAGIRAEKPGFRRVRIQPSLCSELSHASAWHDGPYGRIASSWKREGDLLELEIEIPPNSDAEVHVPCAHPEEATASAAKGGPAARFLGFNGREAVYQVGSGTHRFEVRRKPASR